jgi:hypothetical protein
MVESTIPICLLMTIVTLRYKREIFTNLSATAPAPIGQ